MSRFLIGLLLGALLGIGGTSAFLIVYGGGDYLVSTSPRVRELEAALRHSDEDREWLKSRLREATEVTHRLESRFESLAARFEGLTAAVAPTAAPTTAGSNESDAPPAAPSPLPEPTADPVLDTEPAAATAGTPTPDAAEGADDPAAPEDAGAPDGAGDGFEARNG